MKIRIGFVSNSSSCSFCIYGISFDCRNLTSEEKWPDNLENIIGGFDLIFHYGPDGDDNIYIGRNWADIGDDETGRAFRQDIADKLGRLLKSGFFKKDMKCDQLGTHEMGWYDG